MSKSGRIVLSVDDIRDEAGKRLDRVNTNFFNDGSATMTTVRENSTAFAKYRIRPRVLRDVSRADTSTTMFGRRISFPLSVSPAGIQAMAHPDGELATSRACARKGVNMGVSSFANYSVEEIKDAGRAVAGDVDYAMQLYTMKDREMQKRIIRRAEAAGCKAVFLTADSPVLGVRYNEWRDDFRTPKGLGFPMIERTTEMIQAQTHDDGFVGFNSSSHSWAEVEWLRSQTTMQIWIKGVVTAEDVLLARQYGCDGVIVSNHGGRQLDGIPATIDALPECVAAADGKIPVHIDGGIRTGADIFKAVALGAQCCWVGRPAIWGLAYDGEKGVDKMLDVLYDDFKRCMQLAGCKDVSEITKASLGIVRADGPLARL